MNVPWNNADSDLVSGKVNRLLVMPSRLNEDFLYEHWKDADAFALIAELKDGNAYVFGKIRGDDEFAKFLTDSLANRYNVPVTIHRENEFKQAAHPTQPLYDRMMKENAPLDKLSVLPWGMQLTEAMLNDHVDEYNVAIQNALEEVMDELPHHFAGQSLGKVIFPAWVRKVRSLMVSEYQHDLSELDDTDLHRMGDQTTPDKFVDWYAKKYGLERYESLGKLMGNPDEDLKKLKIRSKRSW